MTSQDTYTSDRDSPSEIDVLIVGPAGRDSGGIARFITMQDRRLTAREGFRPRIEDVAVPDYDSRLEFVVATLVALWRLARLSTMSSPDVMHVHSSHALSFFHSAPYALFGGLVWRVPVVFHIHGSSFDAFVHDARVPLVWFQEFVFGACSDVVVLSEYWNYVRSERVPPDKLTIVPNAVEPDGYSPQYDRDPVHVVYLSGHIERKGVSEFVAAIDRLLSADCPPSMRVTIAGDGPLSHHASDLADRHSAVDYVGFVDEPRKRELLSSGLVYVLPTYAEGLPIAILEAMAGGNAVVSTGVGSIPSVVDDDVGVLVEPGDVSTMVEELTQLVTDSDRTVQMARTSRARVEADYSWDVVTELLVSLYRSRVGATLSSREELHNEGRVTPPSSYR